MQHLFTHLRGVNHTRIIRHALFFWVDGREAVHVKRDITKSRKPDAPRPISQSSQQQQQARLLNTPFAMHMRGNCLETRLHVDMGLKLWIDYVREHKEVGFVDGGG